MGLHTIKHICQLASPVSISSRRGGNFYEREASFLPSLPTAWQCDLATEALTWDAGVFDLFGLERGDAIDRRSTLEMYMPESRQKLDRLRAQALATCGSFTFEAQIRRVDGDLRWIRISADVHKRDGRAMTLYGSKQDITAEMAGYSMMPLPELRQAC